MELIDNLKDYITKLNDKHLDVTKENLSLKDDIEKLNERLENISSVSIIKNLNTQIYEKDLIIQQLEKKLNSIISKNNDLSKKIDSLCSTSTSTNVESIQLNVEEEPVVEEEEEPAVEEDEEEEVVEEEVVEEEEPAVEEEVVEEKEPAVEEEVVEEQEQEVVEEEEEEEVVEEEISFIEKKLKPPNSTSRKLKTYLITDDEYKDIYERLEDGEPGEHVGKLTGKQNKPFFFT